jgi:hypothetical protein
LMCWKWSGARVTRCVCEKMAQNVAQPLFVKVIHNFYLGKK